MCDTCQVLDRYFLKVPLVDIGNGRHQRAVLTNGPVGPFIACGVCIAQQPYGSHTITNCVNYGTITGRELVGGIVGGSWTNVAYTNCVNHGAITATATRAGGIAGEKFPVATLTNCSNQGVIMANGITATADAGTADTYVGYLIGYEKQ